MASKKSTVSKAQRALQALDIAIDFDGTLVYHDYPAIGAVVPGAFEVLKKLQAAGHRLRLWTMRSDGSSYGDTLTAAIEFCRSQGVEFEGHNSYPQTWTSSPKMLASIYIDDAALGCPLRKMAEGTRQVVDWERVEQLLLAQGVLLGD